MRTYRSVYWAEIDPTDAFRSTQFDDHYFAYKDPIGERREIFIDGLDLKKTFASLEENQFISIGETGFGTGLTFALVLETFLTFAPKLARLQWITVEAMPLRPAALKRAHTMLNLTGSLAHTALQLQHQWPDRVGICNRLFFADGRIILDLHLGDATEILSDLTGSIDAWCLDGFNPKKNPEMWSSKLFQSIARLSRRNTKVATFTASRVVKDGLEHAGFVTRKIIGFGGKRNRLSAIFNEVVATNPSTPRNIGNPGDIIIVGAGLSGAWLAHGFAKRGYAVTVLEKDIPGAGASGNRQAITYAKLGIEATPTSLLQLQGLLTLPRLLEGVPDWHQTGVLLLAQSDSRIDRQQKLLNIHDWPESIIRPVSQAEATTLAGVALEHGGILLPTAGWSNPKAITETLLKHERITVRSYSNLLSMKSQGFEHQLVVETSDGLNTINANTVIFACALESSQFAPMNIPLRPVRGQVTELCSDFKLKVPICGNAYLTPSDGMRMTCGATYQPESVDYEVDPQDNNINLNATNQLLAERKLKDVDILSQRVSIRATTPDYAPVAGQLADPGAWSRALAPSKHDANYQPPAPLPFSPGLFILTGQGSKGTLTAPVTAEMVISQVLGEVLPVSNCVRDALAPDRFFRRALIRAN